jgi:hypothetical protein
MRRPQPAVFVQLITSRLRLALVEEGLNMHLLGTIAFLLLPLLPAQQVEVRPVQPPEPQAEQQEQPRYDEGPFEAKIIACREIRLWLDDSIERRPGMESDYRMQIRVSGEKLGRIVRFGNFIVTELVDDQGKSLIDEDTYTEDDLTTFYPNSMPADRLATTGLLLTTRSSEATRTATKLTRCRGYVRLIVGGDKPAESITVLNPLQHVGGQVPDARLAELGVKIGVVPAEEIDQPLPPRAIVFHFGDSANNIQSVTFYDNLLRPMRSRENPATTKAGDDVMVYFVDANGFNDEMSVVFEVNPEIEEVKLEMNADGFELP